MEPVTNGEGMKIYHKSCLFVYSV